MIGRVVLAPDVLLAAVGGAAASDGAAARLALRDWLEHDTDLLVAAPTWLAIIEGLRSQGWSAARIAEALHAIDQLDVETVEVDLPALLLAADVMDRHGVSATMATAVVLADLESASLATLEPTVAAVASTGILLSEDPGMAAGPGASVAPSPSAGPPPRLRDRPPSSLPDYRGLGALLGELRRSASDAVR